MDDLQKQIDTLRVKNAALKGAMTVLIIEMSKFTPDLAKAFRDAAKHAALDKRIEADSEIDTELDNLFMTFAAVAEVAST